ncbi:MAG: membrane protein insertion efficiency factor YidD [Candidatus Latescibacterota bacterium]|nr:MAG: membrane protein insertion efficiency factor YidD [Candidatus Latescibacterota bacterium]
MTNTILCVALAGSLFAGAGGIISGPGLKEPADPLASAVPQTVWSTANAGRRSSAVSPAAVVTRGLFYLYQNILGPTKGTSRCPMSPSCSQYGKLAVRKHGIVKGVFLTGDRLYRCGHDLSYYPRMSTRYRLLHEDPPPDH